VRFGACADPRPILIIECLPNDRYLILPLSAQMALYQNPATQLRIERRDTDYDKTGLPKDECFFDAGEFREIAVSDLIRQYGVLTGDLRKKFDQWF
jgi:hypothetical protein